MRIVVKVGTSTLAHATGHLNIKRVEELCKVLSDVKNAGHEVVLVSSGAIAADVIPPAYPAPSPQGYNPFILLSKFSSLIILTGDDVLATTPKSIAPSSLKPFIV